jgi:DNA-binding transcriptional MerR regulator
MRARLTIGDFSTITHLSVKTLRRYHDAGLLIPDQVDPHSGYRYYSTDQVPTAQIIRRFRELDMPVREIGAVLATRDVDDRNVVIAAHLRRLEDRLAATTDAVAALHKLLDPTPAEIDVVHRHEPARIVAAVEADVALDGVLDWYATAVEAIDEAVTRAGARRTGPPGGLYDNALFTAGAGHALVLQPCEPPPEDGVVRPVPLRARELAVTVHRGAHHDIDVTYAALGTHLAENALTVDGPVHETYLVGPRDSDDADTWRTEIGWPVFRTAS